MTAQRALASDQVGATRTLPLELMGRQALAHQLVDGSSVLMA
jgi:hypothetical protein